VKPTKSPQPPPRVVPPKKPTTAPSSTPTAAPRVISTAAPRVPETQAPPQVRPTAPVASRIRSKHIPTAPGLGEAIALRTRSRTLAEAHDAKAKVNLVMLANAAQATPFQRSHQCLHCHCSP
jgi:hypothetical protein